ncbi:MAG: flagellar protein FlgN, partial [candidate division Zixibacteria bacterium]|nr:flagellar protein FlgN [candidate division Zixibacteria bacterium]
MVNQLIDIIGREATLFESFLQLLEQQQDFLVTNDVDGLNRITDLQREKLVQSQLLDKEREDLVAKIQIANKIDGDLNVSRLLELVDSQQANRLSQLRETIRDLNDRITDVRNQNATLLNRSREYIRKTLEMLTKLNQPETTYTPMG